MADRIIEHPILGKTEKGKKVTFTFVGKRWKDMKENQFR